MCPNSPAALRPWWIVPPRIRPPPTPVPTQTPSRFSNGRPAPRSYSPRTPTLTSLPSVAVTPPSASDTSGPSSTRSKKPGTFAARSTAPALGVDLTRAPDADTVKVGCCRLRLLERGADRSHDRVDHVAGNTGLRRQSPGATGDFPVAENDGLDLGPAEIDACRHPCTRHAQAPRSISDTESDTNRAGLSHGLMRRRSVNACPWCSTRATRQPALSGFDRSTPNFASRRPLEAQARERSPAHSRRPAEADRSTQLVESHCERSRHRRICATTISSPS